MYQYVNWLEEIKLIAMEFVNNNQSSNSPANQRREKPSLTSLPANHRREKMSLTSLPHESHRSLPPMKRVMSFQSLSKSMFLSSFILCVSITACSSMCLGMGANHNSRACKCTSIGWALMFLHVLDRFVWKVGQICRKWARLRLSNINFKYILTFHYILSVLRKRQCYTYRSTYLDSSPLLATLR